MKKSVLFFFALIFVAHYTIAQKIAHTFTLADSVFLLDGKPFQIISGEMHCTRVPRAYWRDRMKMAKAMGLNTIATYIFWNALEPEEPTFT